jgi:hypothetical protein
MRKEDIISPIFRVRGLGVFHVKVISRDFRGRAYLENVKFKVRKTSKTP